jgi:hypothetical protein
MRVVQRAEAELVVQCLRFPEKLGETTRIHVVKD